MVQFPDGAQFVGAVVLRGLNDQTYLALLVCLVYYGVCAPVGTYLALEREWGVLGCYFMTFLGCVFLTGSFCRRARKLVKAAETPEVSLEMRVLLISQLNSFMRFFGWTKEDACELRYS